jgi:hypothetical protein
VGKDGALHLEYLGAPPSQVQASVLAPGRAARISTFDFRDVWARNDAVREMHLGYCQSRLTCARQSAACNATMAGGHDFAPGFCTRSIAWEAMLSRSPKSKRPRCSASAGRRSTSLLKTSRRRA